MPPSRAGEWLEAGMFTHLAGPRVLWHRDGHPHSVHLTEDTGHIFCSQIVNIVHGTPCRQTRHQASYQSSNRFRFHKCQQNFFRAFHRTSAGRSLEHSKHIGCVFGARAGCRNFRAVFRESYPAVSTKGEATPPKHIARTSLGIPQNCPPVMEDHCSLLQCSMLGTGGTCVVLHTPWRSNTLTGPVSATCALARYLPC